MNKIKRRNGEWLVKPKAKQARRKSPLRLSFPDLVRAELIRARDGHGPINSLHEGFAVILEEVDEFKAEVWKKRSKRNLKKTLAELVQVAAMAQRTAEDVLLD